jgi:hypothetical protein
MFSNIFFLISKVNFRKTWMIMFISSTSCLVFEGSSTKNITVLPKCLYFHTMHEVPLFKDHKSSQSWCFHNQIFLVIKIGLVS